MDAKRRKISDSDAASEEAVGISEYVSPELKGFTGLIKQRYSDFQVNEISLDGTVVELKQLPTSSETDTTTPKVPHKEEEKQAKQETNNEMVNKIEKSETTDKLEKIIQPDLVAKLIELANSSSFGEKVTISGDYTKEQRTEIHTLIREGFKSILDSRTDNGQITASKPKQRKDRKPRQANATGPKGSDFLHFTLYKENKDTMEAVSLLSKLLHIPNRSITFCGTKDRRAATTQQLCWRRGNTSRLIGLQLRGNMVVSDFEFKDYTLRLGDLTGNQFGIVIRKVDPLSIDDADAALSSLRNNGFINYYGLQRFGTFSVPSHVIGKYILCEDFESAVNALLNPAKQTLQESLEAREVWANEHDAAKALKLMPRRCLAECAILDALVDSNSSLNAILRVPHNLKTMYVHAYQSYVWNSMVSERIKLNRTEPLIGDLVFSESNEEGGVQRARLITEEEVKNKSKTIFDVVLPTPGFDVQYPANIVTKYEELMSKDGIDCHNMKRKIKEFSLFGSYRHLLAKPLFCDWSVRKYANDDDTVLYTDKEAIEHKTKYPPEAGDNYSVVIKLGLASSQYATMALREAMKQETSRNGSMYYV